MFVKITGGKGLHVVVPITPKQDWNFAKEFSKALAQRIVRSAPDQYTATMAKTKRRGKIFIDYLRNGRGTTAVGAYSPRARAGFPIAAPVTWEYVEKGGAPDAFTLDRPTPRSKTR